MGGGAVKQSRLVEMARTIHEITSCVRSRHGSRISSSAGSSSSDTSMSCTSPPRRRVSTSLWYSRTQRKMLALVDTALAELSEVEQGRRTQMARVQAAEQEVSDLKQKLEMEQQETEEFVQSQVAEYETIQQQFMEYIRDHGSFADVPVERIVAAMRTAYGDARIKRWMTAYEDGQQEEPRGK